MAVSTTWRASQEELKKKGYATDYRVFAVSNPRDNEPDLEELPPETKKELEFVLVDTIEEVFEAAFDGKGATRSKPVAVPQKQVAQPSVNVASSRSQASVSPPRS